MYNNRRCLKCFNEYSTEFEICPFCGNIESNEMENDSYLKPGTILKDRYLIGDVIGAGGFGITYAGWDNVLDVKIAVKEYFPTAFVHRNNYKISISGEFNEKQYYTGLNRFLNEARQLAKFNNIDGIVHVNDYIQENNTAYIIMEFLEGMTLKEYLQNKEFLTVQETLNIIRPVLKGLNEIHKEGLIHRDISTDNIMICENGDIKLIDFGAARVQSNDEKHQYSVILKPSYAPPEQYNKDSRQDARTDIYAIGAVMYNMLTGNRPQESISRLYNDELNEPSKIIKSIPKWLELIVLKCMALEIDKRYDKAIDVLNDIDNHFQSNETKHSKKVSIIMIVIFALVLCVVIYSAVSDHRNQFGHIVLEPIEKTTEEITNINNFKPIEFETILCYDGTLLVDMYNPNEKDVDIILCWSNSDYKWNETLCIEGNDNFEYWISNEEEYGDLLDLDIDIKIEEECLHQWE